MAVLSIRIDDELKKQMDEVLDELGLTTTAATMAFYKQVVRHNGMPFALQAGPLDREKTGFKGEKDGA